MEEEGAKTEVKATVAWSVGMLSVLSAESVEDVGMN